MKNKGITVFFCCNLLIFLLTTILFVTTDAASQQKSQNKVTIAFPSEPDSLLPTDSSYGVTSNPISNNIFERIVDLSTDGKFVPGIASWEVLKGGREFLFTLRKDVKLDSEVTWQSTGAKEPVAGVSKAGHDVANLV